MTNLEHLAWEPYDRHWIRLRGPWTVQWLTPSEPVTPDPQRVTLPADWRQLFGSRPGTARFSRRFQQPSNLDAEERLLITLCDVRCDVTARLNESPLTPIAHEIGDPLMAPSEDRLSYEVTDLMQGSNLLVLDLTATMLSDREESVGLWRPVLLEIITPE